MTAAGRDMQRREARRALEAKLGLATMTAAGGGLALRPPPTPVESRAALARLHDPVQRFQAEFFWFWPMDEGGRDPALRAVEEGRLADAAALWGREVSAPDRRAVARHNLAVLLHLSVLDQEQADAKPDAELEGMWRRALDQWAEIHADREFWLLVSRRAAALDDVKVSPRLVSQVRESLPTGLLHIHALLAFAAAERSHIAGVTRQLRILREARFDAGARQAALRHALTLWEGQIKEEIDRARTTWRTAPHRANENVRSMYEVCTRLISTVDAVVANVGDLAMDGPVLGHVRNDLHDMVAEAMFEGQVTFTAKIDDWDESAELLELARKMAAGDPLRARLDENLSVVRENAKSASEWCAPGYWDLPEALIGRLEEARELVRRSDFEGALRLLNGIELTHERPIRRAASHCLAAWAVQIFNAAISEYRQEPPIRRRLVDRFAAERSPTRRFPDAEMPDFLKAPCPSCGSQEYKRWSQFKVRDVEVWLCGSCADLLDQEVEGQRNAFRRELTSALERLLLADELYPDDAKVKLNLEILEQQAHELQCALPGTVSLKARLHRNESFLPATQTVSPRDSTCHFCESGSPTSDCAISVPMCGDVENRQGLLGRSVVVRTTMIVVPRCRACRDAHRDLAVRRIRWNEIREDMVRAAASGIGPKARVAAGFAGALAWSFAAYGLHFVLPGVILPTIVGLVAGAGATVAATVGIKRSLAAKGEAAIKAFMTGTPEPSLPSGIKPEEAYLDFRTIRELRRERWSFGHVYAPEQAVSEDAVGLVAAASRVIP
ncbi:MAG: hypothetical protein U1E60_30050 [Reyranellaceae bacterium]